MRSKNSRAIDLNESAHMAAVKALPCACCGAPAPSSAHHDVQGDHFTTIPLCWDCHQGPHGLHGDQARLRTFKKTLAGMLNWTIRMLIYGTQRIERQTARDRLSSDKVITHKEAA
jgi:hypothetical protein